MNAAGAPSAVASDQGRTELETTHRILAALEATAGNPARALEHVHAAPGLSRRRTLTIEVTGTNEKIDAFERMIRPHGLIEMARTGEVAISRSRPDA